MTQATYPVTIEVNIAPSLMEHSSLYIKSIEDAIRDTCGNPQATFSRCNGFSGPRRGNALTVYPIHDEVIVPDFKSNLCFSSVAYSEVATTDYRTLVNGYVSTLGEAMAFPNRSLVSHAGVVLGTIKRLVKPAMMPAAMCSSTKTTTPPADREPCVCTVLTWHSTTSAWVRPISRSLIWVLSRTSFPATAMKTEILKCSSTTLPRCTWSM